MREKHIREKGVLEILEKTKVRTAKQQRKQIFMKYINGL